MSDTSHIDLNHWLTPSAINLALHTYIVFLGLYYSASGCSTQIIQLGIIMTSPRRSVLMESRCEIVCKCSILCKSYADLQVKSNATTMAHLLSLFKPFQASITLNGTHSVPTYIDIKKMRFIFAGEWILCVHFLACFQRETTFLPSLISC